MSVLSPEPTAGSTSARRGEAAVVRLSSRSGRAVVVAAVLGTALAYMSDDMLNVAIPSVARDLGGTITDIQWVVDSYYVTLVALVLVAGAIGDRIGHRRLLLAGMGVFSFGAALCAIAPGMGVLVAGRAVQGVGAAVMLTAGLALVSGLIHPSDRNRAIGLFMGLVAAVPALGPFLSGLLVDLVSWRALFVVPLVLPVAAAIVTRTYVPEGPRADARRLDVAGAGAAFVALSSLSVGLILLPGRGLTLFPVVALFVSVGGLVTFVRIELRAADPMLPLRFFRRRVFLCGNIVWLLACMVSWAAVFFVAISLQTTLGLRPMVAGLALVPIYLIAMVVAPMAGKVADAVGPRVPIVAGLTTFTAGLWILSTIGPDARLLPDAMAGIVVLALGMATTTAPLVAATFSALDVREQGVAAGMNNAMGQLAGLLAIAILPAVVGLGGVPLSSTAFADGHPAALRISAAMAAVATVLAAATFRPGVNRRGGRRRESVARRSGGAGLGDHAAAEWIPSSRLERR